MELLQIQIASTIQAVVVLKPLDEKYSIKRIVYSTYQAVSGAGQLGIDDYNKFFQKTFLQKNFHMQLQIIAYHILMTF